MAFQKGQSGNPLGKPKGCVSKTSAQVREVIQGIVANNLERIQEDLDLLDPAERVKAIIALTAYTIPKPMSIDLEAKVQEDSLRVDIYAELEAMAQLSSQTSEPIPIEPEQDPQPRPQPKPFIREEEILPRRKNTKKET